MELLTQIKKLWDNDRIRLLKTGDRILEAISTDKSSGDGTPDKSLMRTAFSQFSRNYDSRWGGFGSAPKFPAAHNLLFLMDYAVRENEPEALKMAIKTLQAMAAGGIYDQIGGGFSRYSTDQKWLVPHFEKMLYDNALLMMAYTRGFQLTGDERLAQAARSTGEYVLRELMDDEGGFYCGQDADSDGVEGKYYVFTESEIMTVLSAREGREFCRIYDITDKGNFEGKNIPNLLTSGAKGWDTASSALKKLYEYRRQRTRLHTDDKILLSWNSWMIIAMVQTGRTLGEEKFLHAAVRASSWAEENMTDEADRLYLRYRDGEAAHAGQLEDYAVYGLALLELYSLTFEVKYLRDALHRAQQMTELFEDEENGGFFMNASDSEQLIARPKETYDGAMPSGNSAAAMLLQKLSDLTGEVKWKEAADRQHSFMAGNISGYPAGHSFGLMAMAEVLYPHRELICAGEAVAANLIEFMKNGGNQGITVLFKSQENSTELAECAPFTAEHPVPEEGVMWYLCENGACRTPVKNFEDLRIQAVMI